MQVQKQESPTQPVAQQQQPQAKPDPRAETWATKNDWFGQDRVMTTQLLLFINNLLKKKGLTRRAMSTILRLIVVFVVSFLTKFHAKKIGWGKQVASAGAPHPAVQTGAQVGQVIASQGSDCEKTGRTS